MAVKIKDRPGRPSLKHGNYTPNISPEAIAGGGEIFVRNCLSCSKSFQAYGKFQRLCGACRGRR